MKLGIVIVLYNPDIRHVSSIVNSFLSHNVSVALIDNSPESKAFTAESASHYLHFPENIGIAKAQNEGMRLLFDEDCERVMLLDQDSHITVTDLFKLNGQFSEIASSRFIAAIGPSILCEFSNTIEKPRVQREQKSDNEVKQVRQIIASGMLLSKEAFECVGAKEVELFIDGVDHEWCWRAAVKGFGVYKSELVVMRHKQGDDRVRCCGITFKQGAPVRLYYQFRNIFILTRRGYVPFYWKIRNLFAIPIRYFVNRFVFTNGSERARYMHQGIKDGLGDSRGRIKKI
ncbi:glycosyltransferase family 2 protein [Alteromonas sp. KUL49]|uniref:glycosyltransferase family 2 protein n=1 Tax=Alteromonas sp. KUL49 TaxID=2480798 RepID=UPI00102EF486|nr:glycosyltransferase family 2 protein [Alteromonas sp. KUL49]TAP35012.1 glycosyltransferase family 2 protein [Alteromonas sp. KUL49]GEA13460.1 dTDP-rhamnosyl transferase RfbF [Alteromonas sp. KUL49]